VILDVSLEWPHENFWMYEEFSGVEYWIDAVFLSLLCSTFDDSECSCDSLWTASWIAASEGILVLSQKFPIQFTTLQWKKKDNTDTFVVYDHRYDISMVWLNDVVVSCGCVMAHLLDNRIQIPSWKPQVTWVWGLTCKSAAFLKIKKSLLSALSTEESDYCTVLEPKFNSLGRGSAAIRLQPRLQFSRSAHFPCSRTTRYSLAVVTTTKPEAIDNRRDGVQSYGVRCHHFGG